MVVFSKCFSRRTYDFGDRVQMPLGMQIRVIEQRLHEGQGYIATQFK
jgi:hypothetical protein